MFALASIAGAAVAQEVVATIDYSKLRQYPYGDQGFNTVIEGGALILTDKGDGWPQCTIIADVPMEANTTYTVTVAMKGSKKGASNLVAGQWGHEFYSSVEPLKFTDKWEKCSAVFNITDDPGTITNEETGETTLSSMIRMQPNNYAEVMEIAWVVVSKGDAEPESTPLMPVDLNSAEEVAYVNFSELGSYEMDGDSASLVDGVLVNQGDDIFNVLEGLTLDPELDYGVIARVKASSDVEVGVSLGNWGAVVDGSFLAYDGWNQVIVRLGLPVTDEETGKIPEDCFVMFSPEDGFDGTVEVEWVKLVYFVEPEVNEPVYKTEWSMVIDDLTGANGESDNVWSRTGEVGAWTDAICPVTEGPDGAGQVFYADVPAHPLVAEGEEDPIPDHHVQFFIQYPDNMFKVGDILKVKFDYYSTVERQIDTQSHYTPGDYIHYEFIGSFIAKPEWQTYEAEVEITDTHVGGHEEQGCITLNLCTTKDANGNKVDMPAGIFYMNHITVEKGEQVLVSGEEPVLEWQSIITNGNANDGVSANVLARVDGVDSEAAVVDNPAGDGKVFEAPIIAKTDGVNDWDSQMFIEFNQALEEGTQIKVSFDYYSTNERTVQTQAHGAPGTYHHWDMLGSLEAKPEWQSIEKTLTISADQAGDEGCKAIAFNLSTSEEAGTFYINNVVVEALLPTDNTAVEEIEAAPAVVAVPAGVYNLQGVKVANSLDEVTVPGLYISNGKKIIKK